MLNFELLLAALRLSTQDEDGLFDLTDIECICANLIDQVRSLHHPIEKIC